MTKSESAQITAQTVLLESAEQVLQLRSAAGVRLAIPDTNNLIMVGTADWIAANVPCVEVLAEQPICERLACDHIFDLVAKYRSKDGSRADLPKFSASEILAFAKAIEGEVILGYQRARLAATTQASTAQAEVKVERNRVWIVKGNQSFRLAYVPDEGDDPAEMQAYASNLRSAISIFTPCVKSVEQEAATSSPDAQAAPTDISRRLRDCIAQNVVPFPADVLAAADEIERYYGGMMAWKANAQAKDRTIIEQREQLAQPLASTAAQPEQAVAWMKPDEIEGLIKAASEGMATRHYGRVYARQYDADMVAVAALAVPATTAEPGLLAEILSLAEQGMCHGLTADDFCSRIVAKLRAAPASTAAQPEQTSERDKVDIVTAVLDQFGLLQDVNNHRTEELCHALHAALAIPASTAAARHALRDGYAGSTLVSDFAGPKITLRYATTTQAEAAHVVLCAMIDGPAASEQQAGADELDPAAVTAAVAAWRDSTNHPASGNLDRIDIGRAISAYLAALTHRATTAAPGALTDAQIIAALHSEAIDTYPSKYGFDAVQVSATSVPSLRKVFERLAAAPDVATTAADGSIDGQLTGAPSAVKKAADQQGDTASECVYVSLQADSLDDWERYVFETCSKAQNIYDLHFRIGDQEWKGSLREVMAALRGAAMAAPATTGGSNV